LAQGKETTDSRAESRDGCRAEVISGGGVGVSAMLGSMDGWDLLLEGVNYFGSPALRMRRQAVDATIGQLISRAAE